MSEVAGQITLLYTDSEYEVALGGEFDIFDFDAGGELNEDTNELFESTGHVNDNGGSPTQRVRSKASAGSNHFQEWVDDRCIRLRKWNGSAFVTLIEASYVERTATGIILNVTVANSDYPIWINARTAS